MRFIGWISDLISFASAQFYIAYLEVQGWPLPYHLLAEPLYRVHRHFHYLAGLFIRLDEWASNVDRRLDTILTYQNIASYFLQYFEYGRDAFIWVSHADEKVIEIIEPWLKASFEKPKGWFETLTDIVTAPVRMVETSVNKAWEILHELVLKMPSITEMLDWFTMWPARVLATMLAQGFVTSLDALGLIDTEFTKRLPFYDNLTSLWPSITEFISNPFEWAYTRAEDFFDKYW